MNSFKHETGDIFDYAYIDTAVAHGVNCVGLMGAGLALQMRRRYPEMYRIYQLMCLSKTLVPGGFFPWVERKNWDPTDYDDHPGIECTIINCASQDLPGANAKTEWLLSSLNLAAAYCNAQGLRLVVPEIGAGIGGLDRNIVFEVFEVVGGLVDLTVVTYG